MKQHSNISNSWFVIKSIFRFSRTKVICEIVIRSSEMILLSFSSLWLLYKVVNLVENNQDFYSVLPWIIGTAFSYAVYFGLKVIYENCLREREEVAVQTGLQIQLSEKLKSIDLIRFDSPDFLAKLERAELFVRTGCAQIFSRLVNLAAFLLMMLNTVVFLWQIAPVLLGFGLVTFVLYAIGKRYGKNNAVRQTELIEENRRQEYTKSLFLNRRYAKEIRTSNIRNVLNQQFRNSSSKKIAVVNRYSWKMIALSVLQSFFSVDGIEIGCYLYVAVKAVFFQDISVSEIAVLFSAVIQYTSRLRRINKEVIGIRGKSVLANSFRELINEDEMIEGTEKCSDLFKELSIRGVSFSYGKNEILHNISFDIHPGEKIMIAGENGAGKSTLVKVLMGLYVPTKGEILYNGTSINHYKRSSYQNHFSYLPQDFQVYEMSIKDNILLNASDVSDITLKNALTLSGADRWIGTLQNGIETHLGREFDKNGIELSGGQSQSVALARIFLHSRDIYILDEPSSALDPAAESDFFKHINSALKDKTVLFISHRFSSALLADKVLFLESGYASSFGTHEELLKNNKHYSQLYYSQAKYYSDSSSI